MSPREVWWRFLLGRIEQVKARIPDSCRGVVQFTISGPGGVTHLHLVVDGPRTHGREGVADAHAHVRVHEDALDDILHQRDAGSALELSGKRGLLEELLSHLNDAPAPRAAQKRGA